MNITLLRLSFALTAVLLSGCPGEPTVTAIDSGVPPPDLLNANPEAQVRIGHFIAAASPLDVCVQAAGESTWRGPLIREQTSRNGGVFYGNVSAYVKLPAGKYNVLAVPGMNDNCNTAFAGFPPITSFPPFLAGRIYTVVGAGNFADYPMKIPLLTVIEDDHATQSGQARLRFINASRDVTSAELGSGEGASYQPLFSAAMYGSFGQPQGAGSGSGAYLTTGPKTSTTFSVRASGMSTDLLALRNKISIAAGSVSTAFLVGLLPPSLGNAANPLKLVQCDDTMPAVSGLTVCAEVVP